MAKGRTEVRFQLEVTFQQREGYFAATTSPFAVTGYGNTEDAAAERALKAVKFLVEQYPTKQYDLCAYLKRRGVKYTLGSEEASTPPVRICKQTMQMKVPVGV